MAKTLSLSVSAAVISGAIVYTQQYSILKSTLIVVVAAYVASCFDGSEKDGSRQGPWIGKSNFSHVLWTKLLGLPLSEVRWNKEKDFKNKEQQYIFASHPHGVASLHHIGTMLLPVVSEPGKAFEDISPVVNRRELAASFVVQCPILRDLSLTSGAVDANRKVASRMLQEGKTLGILVGGEQEQLLSRHGEHTVYINNRKGFIKLALRFGVPVVPCYCFGETDLYHQSGMFINLRVWVAKKFGIALVLAVGRSWLMPWLPHKVKLVQVVGSPIYPTELKKKGEPSSQEIDALHAKYVQGLKTLFDENKAKCGYPKAVLNIV